MLTSDFLISLLAKTIVHEFTHIWWIAGLNHRVQEVYTIRNLAALAWGDGCGPTPDNPEVIENADNYGLYCEYGYFAGKGLDRLWDESHLGPYPVFYPVKSW